MFDWDRDYEDVVRDRTMNMSEFQDEDGAPGQTAPRRSRSKQMVLGALALMIVSAPAFTALNDMMPWSESRDVSIAVFDISQHAMPATNALRMPESMAMYDREAFERFAESVSRVSDADIVSFAVTVRRDLDEGDWLMAPYQSDMLALIRLEMERRGLIETRSQGLTTVPSILRIPSAVPAPATSAAADVAGQDTDEDQAGHIFHTLVTN